MNGSFNWTTSAIMRNRENVIVTRDATMVAQFKREYARLWRLWGEGCLQLRKQR